MRATGDKVERNRRGREERPSGVAFVTRGAFHLDPIMKSVMPCLDMATNLQIRSSTSVDDDAQRDGLKSGCRLVLCNLLRTQLH